MHVDLGTNKHIISKEYITIDLEQAKVISQLPLPCNKKTMQSFFRKFNFMHKFVSGFAKTIKPLQKTINKDVEFKWNKQEKEPFEKIKISISNTMVLCNLDFKLNFILYTFDSYHSLVVVLMQKIC
jgi:hypothetical protein